MSTSTIFKDIQSFRLAGADTTGRQNLRVFLKIIAKSSNFIKVNYHQNTLQVTDTYQPVSKPLVFDKILNEYSEPIKLDQLVESFQKWENVVVLSFSNNTQWSVINDVSKMQQAKNMQEGVRTSLAVIKSPSRFSHKFSNPNLSVRDNSERPLKLTLSFYAYSGDGVLDFGKFAFDKIKYKKEINDIEKVPTLNALVEDSKTGELYIKGLTKYENPDPEQLINFFINASQYCSEYLIKKYPDNDEKFFHQVLHMTIQSNSDPRLRCQFYIVDFAAPIQSPLIEQQLPNLNPFLHTSLQTFATFLKEYHKDKYAIINQLHLKALQQINFDSNPLSRLFKKILMSKETNIFPLFVINSKEEYKEESKQLLTLSQQIQGIFQTLNIVEEIQGSKFMTPMIGQNFLKPEDVASAIQMEKLGKENAELRRQVEYIKKVQKNKLDEFKVLMGIDCDLEALLKAKPNSKEYNTIKFYKEARERAETLGRINKDLDKKCNSLQEEYEKIYKEKLETEKKYRKLQHQIERKIQAYEEETAQEERNYELEFQQDKKDAKVILEEDKKKSYEKMKDKANLLFSLSKNTEQNTNTLALAYDYKDRGEKFAEHEYKSQLLEKKRSHKENIYNLTSNQQKEVQQLDEYLESIIPQCKDKKIDIQNQIDEAKQEMLKLYDLTQQQQNLIQKVEEGEYNKGFHSHFVPQSHKPNQPTQETFPELFETVTKKKIKNNMIEAKKASESLINQKNQLRNKQHKQQTFMETFLMKTQQIAKQNQNQLLLSQERYKQAEQKGAFKRFERSQDFMQPMPSSARSRRHLGHHNKKSSGRQSRQGSRKNLNPSLGNSARSISPGRIAKPDYEKLRLLHKIEDINIDMIEKENDLYAFAKDLQMEYWREIESEENPKELKGEHFSTVLQDLDKFKMLYEQELKVSNERMYKEGINNRVSAVQIQTQGSDILNYMTQNLNQFNATHSSFRPGGGGVPMTASGQRQLMSQERSQREGLMSGQGNRGFERQKPFLFGNQKLEFKVRGNRALSRGVAGYNSHKNLLLPQAGIVDGGLAGQEEKRLRTAKQKVRWF